MPRLDKPEICRGCVGDTWRHPIGHTSRLTEPHTGWSRDEGAGTSGVLVCAEALGQNEDADGLPLRPQAQAGSLFERALKRCGYDRSMFRLTNIVRCRPPHDILTGASYEFEVIQHCRSYLLDTLREMSPRCILALGGTAFRELTGYEGPNKGSHIRGDMSCRVSCKDGNTYLLLGPSTPRSCAKADAKFGVLCYDIKLAVEVARREFHSTAKRNYLPHPSLDQANSYYLRALDSPNLWLAYDIETPNSAEMDEDERDEDFSYELKQVQFSLGIGEG